MNGKLKRFFQTSHQTKAESTALLLLRLIVGVAFLLHGYGKITNPFGWMPATSGVPGIFQFLGALAEFGGGIALMLGLLTRLSSLGIFFTMLVATGLHALIMKDPFVNLTGGSSYELALVYLGISLLFLIIGPGRFSLDQKIFGEKQNHKN